MAGVPTTAAAAGAAYAPLISLGLGLSGVVLARIVFVDRESRRTKRRQSFGETAPLTGIAMLIAGTAIWDRHLGFSLAALTGIGTGWTAILLVDMLGKKVLQMFGGEGPPKEVDLRDMREPGNGRSLHDLPDDMDAALDLLDHKTKDGGKPGPE